MSKENLDYHASLDFYHRKDYPDMFAKLTDNFRVLVDQVRVNKCNKIVTPLIYNLTEWILRHIYGKGMVYAMNFEEAVLPILKQHCEDLSVTSRIFGNKFYPRAKRVLATTVNVRAVKQKVRARIVKSPDASTSSDGSSEGTNLATMTDAVSQMPMSRICFLAKQSQAASENKFMTSFCAKLLSELGVTSERVGRTFIYRTQSGDRYLIRKQIIKAVMTQLRLRICAEALRLGLLKIGEKAPFSSKSRILLKIGKTGMLIVPQGDDGPERTTHLNPVYYPLLMAIESALAK